MTDSFTAIAAIIAAIAAIISPLITSHMQFQNELRMKRFELLHTDIVQSATKVANLYPRIENNDGIAPFQSALWTLLAQTENREIRMYVESLINCTHPNEMINGKPQRMDDIFICLMDSVAKYTNTI